VFVIIIFIDVLIHVIIIVTFLSRFRQVPHLRTHSLQFVIDLLAH